MSDVRIVHKVAQRGTIYTFERTSLLCLTRATTYFYLQWQMQSKMQSRCFITPDPLPSTERMNYASPYVPIQNVLDTTTVMLSVNLTNQTCYQ